MAKQLDSSRRIAHSSDKGSGRDRLAEFEPYSEVKERMGRMAAASPPLAGLGGGFEHLERAMLGSVLSKRMAVMAGVQERFERVGVAAARMAASPSLAGLGGGFEHLERAMLGSVLSKRMAVMAGVQERFERVGVAAARMAASPSLAGLGGGFEHLERAMLGSVLSKRMAVMAGVQERFERVGVAAARMAASPPLAGLGGGIERLQRGLSVPPVPRLPRVPMGNFARLLSLPPRHSVRPTAAQSELSKRFLSSQRDASLELTLAAYDPAFADQLRGVWLRGKERGPDWLTQAAASCRKLLLGLLHTAAPNERVLPWAKKRRVQLDPKGRPTRRTKIDWLCRSIENRAYRGFVRNDLNTVLEVLALCNQAVHVNESPDFEESFELAIARVESGIRHIIELSGHQCSK